METVAAYWDSVTTWWAELPPIPELDLPVPGDPDLMVVVATVLLAFSLTVTLTAWVDKRWSWIGIFVVLFSASMYFWIWEGDRENFGWVSVPEAFVEMIARAIR